MTTDHRFNFHRSLLAASLGVLALCSTATAATIEGKTDAAAVWVSVANPPLGQDTLEMRNREKSFLPPLLIVPVGDSVRFPNDDPFYHSIYSVSPSDPFDIGFYDNGPGKVVPFPNPGVVTVHCHIHAFMQATIIVTDGPSWQPTDGTYRLEKVPPGKHVLHTWSATGGEKTQAVTVASNGDDITLDLNR